MNARLAIGIDLGGTSTKVALVDAVGSIVAADSFPTRGGDGTEPFIQSAVAAVHDLLSRGGVDRASLAGVGVGSPGPIELKRGVLLKTANLPWVDFPIRDELAARLELPVVLDNDANAAAYGEYWCGRESGPQNMVLLTLGTGVGAGVVLDGHVLHGQFDNAGELGHMIVSPGGLLCGCGQRGCLEAYSSAAAVAKRFATAIKAGDRSVLASTPAVDAKSIAEAAKKGDVLSLKIWDEACFFLAIAAINLQHAYNPEVVRLGGGMSEAGAFLVDSVRRHFVANKWNLHNDFPRIELARLGSDAGVIGAAASVLSTQNR